MQRAQTQVNTKQSAAWVAAGTGALLLAWGLFVTHIGLESMWYDEAISWSMASVPSVGALMDRYPLGTGHPPFYFLWTWAWIHWTGSEHWAIMRLSAAVPMLLAVAATFRVGCDWFRSRWVGLGAAVFMATSGMVIYYAREMRMYGLIILLTVISWWLVRRWLEGRGNWVTLAAYGATVALMGYTHYLSAFIVLTQFIAALIFYRRRALPLLAAYALTALALLPWLPIFAEQQYTASTRAGRDGSFSIGSLGQFNATEATSFDAISDWFVQYSAGQGAFIGGLMLVGLVMGVAGRGRYRRSVILVGMWLLLTLALVWAVNLAILLYSSRYVQTVIPAMALLVGIALHQLPGRARLPLLLTVGLAGMIVHTAAFRPPKTPHYELLTTVAERRLPGDKIWYNLSIGALGSYIEEEVLYYMDEVTTEYVMDDFVWDAPEDFSDPDLTRVWDIRPFWIPMPAAAEAALKDGRTLSERYEFRDFRVRLYESPPSGQTPVQMGDLFAMTAGAVDTSLPPGETLRLKLWWQTLQHPVLDYSLGLRLRDANGQVVAQTDGGLVTGIAADEQTPTSQWFESDEFALAVPEIVIPQGLAPGTYTVWVTVYYWENPEPLPLTADESWTVEGGLVQVAEITVES